MCGDKQMSFLSLMAVLLLMMYLYMGIYAYISNKRAALNIMFLLLSITLAIWMIAGVFIYSDQNNTKPWIWYKMALMANCILPYITINFVFILTKKYQYLKNIFIQALLITPPCFIIYQLLNQGKSAIFTLSYNYGNWVLYTQQHLRWIDLGYIFLCSIISLFLVLNWYFSSKLKLEKKHLKILLICNIIHILCVLGMGILPHFISSYILSAVYIFSTLIWFLGLWYILTKTKSMDKYSFSMTNEILSQIDDLLLAFNKNENVIEKLQKEIEEKKKIEKELIESNEKFKELDKIKTDFLSMISHEFRTPLTSILGFSKIINKKLKLISEAKVCENDKKMLDSLRKMTENVDIIIIEGEKLTCLINDVLEIAKMESGNMNWNMQHISVIDIVEAALSRLKNDLSNKNNIKLIKSYYNKDCIVNGDHEKLVEVAERIVSNSLKFTEKGNIDVRVFVLNNYAVISVVDTGIGISIENIENIFEKFRQIGDTLTNKPQGTGLGLAICKQIVEHHKGKIWVESEPGEGSNFTFILPEYSALKEEKST